MYAVRRKRCAASAGISASVRRRTVPDTSSGRLQSSLVSGGANRARTRVVRVGSSAVPSFGFGRWTSGRSTVVSNRKAQRIILVMARHEKKVEAKPDLVEAKPDSRFVIEHNLSGDDRHGCCGRPRAGRGRASSACPSREQADRQTPRQLCGWRLRARGSSGYARRLPAPQLKRDPKLIRQPDGEARGPESRGGRRVDGCTELKGRTSRRPAVHERPSYHRA